MTLPDSTKTPGFSLSEIFGGPGTSSGSAAMRALLVGLALTAGLNATEATSGTTAVTRATAAGTVPVHTPTPLYSPADAAVKFGFGSEIHRGARAFFAHFRTGALWAVAVAESGGARASVVLTPTGAPNASGTARVKLAGHVVEVAVSSSDTPSTLGLALARAINDVPELPVTADNDWATGAVTVTAKNVGPRGNYITVAVELVSATARVRSTPSALAPSLFGLTLTVSGGASAGGAYRLSGGTTDESWAAALASVSNQRFERIAAPCYLVAAAPSANLARLADHVDALGGLPQMYGQQALLGCVESLGNAIAAAASLNRFRVQLPWLRFGDALPIEVAAQVAAARLAGDDGVPGVGAGIPGESATPAANLNGLELATLAPPETASDVPSATEVEAALNAGVAPIVPSPDRPGRCALVASNTARASAGGVPDFSVYKTKEVTVLDRVRDEVITALRRTYRGYNLAPDRADKKPPETPRTVTPSTVRAFVLSLLRGYARLGWIVQVDERAAELTARINATNPRRLDMDIPCTPTPDFDLGTGALRQLSPLTA